MFYIKFAISATYVKLLVPELIPHGPRIFIFLKDVNIQSTKMFYWKYKCIFITTYIVLVVSHDIESIFSLIKKDVLPLFHLKELAFVLFI